MVPSKKVLVHKYKNNKMNISTNSKIHKTRLDTYIKYIYLKKKMSFSPTEKLSQKKRKIFDSRTKGIEL